MDIQEQLWRDDIRKVQFSWKHDLNILRKYIQQFAITYNVQA
jgi:hypothetical protein